MATEITGYSLRFASQTKRCIPGVHPPGYKDYKVLHWHIEGNILPTETVIGDNDRWRVQHDSMIVGIQSYSRMAWPGNAVTCQGILDHFLVLNNNLAPPFLAAYDHSSVLGTDIGFRTLAKSWCEQVWPMTFPLVEDDEIWQRVIFSNVLGTAAVHASFIGALSVHIIEK